MLGLTPYLCSFGQSPYFGDGSPVISKRWLEESLFGPEFMGAKSSIGRLGGFGLGGLECSIPGLFDNGGFLGGAPSIGCYGRFAMALSKLYMPVWPGFAGFGTFVSGEQGASGFGSTFDPNSWKNAYQAQSGMPPLPPGLNGGMPPSISGGSPSTTTSGTLTPQVKPREHKLSSSAETFIKSGGDGKSLDKPKITYAFEDHGGKEYVVAKLKYVSKDLINKEAKEFKDEAKVLREALTANKDMIIEVGNHRFSVDKTLKKDGVIGIDDRNNRIEDDLCVEALRASEDAANESLPEEVTGKAFSMRVLSRFTVNMDDKNHYFVDASQADGEAAIRKTTAVGQKEDVWVYAEFDLGDKTYRRWFECGERSATNAQGNETVTPNLAFLKELNTRGARFQAVSIYHNHPQHENVPGTTTIYPPSIEDVSSKASTELKKAGIDITDERVVTSQGIYVLRIKPNYELPQKMDTEAEYLEKRRKVLEANPQSNLSEVVREFGIGCDFIYFDNGAGT